MVERDAGGVYRFGPDLKDARDLRAALDRLVDDDPAQWEPLVDAHRAATLDVWEEVFSHRAYTGRSGSMYEYEGVGSIYWHMVSKLNLAMQECVYRAHDGGADEELLDEMVQSYWRLREGRGDHKTFEEYGAFPTDAYSHALP